MCVCGRVSFHSAIFGPGPCTGATHGDFRVRGASGVSIDANSHFNIPQHDSMACLEIPCHGHPRPNPIIQLEKFQRSLHLSLAQSLFILNLSRTTSNLDTFAYIFQHVCPTQHPGPGGVAANSREPVRLSQCRACGLQLSSSKTLMFGV